MTATFDDYLLPGKRGFLIGIGGVSMSPLAEVLHGEGLAISGSDMQFSEKVAHLESLGVPVIGETEFLARLGRA